MWSSIVEKIFFCPPPFPPLCDPKFYPSPRALFLGTSLFEAFFPPSGKKSVPMCGSAVTKVNLNLQGRIIVQIMVVTYLYTYIHCP